MKLRKLIALTASAAVVMTQAAVISMPSASAATDGETLTFTENFDEMPITDTNDAESKKSTIDTLMADGWHAVDNNKAYTPGSGGTPETSDSLFHFVTVMGDDSNHYLRLNTPKSSPANYKLGLGRLFPGQGTSARGIWEIDFKFKPYVTGSTKAQFNFGMNTYGADVDETVAQHNIISAYNNKMYMGYRDYMPLYDGAGVPQGRIDGAGLAIDWYDVRVIVNCDARYYSVELSRGGELVSRRSALSFSGDESIGFFKMSALGMGTPTAVYVDDITIKPAEREALIYNEDFEAFAGVELVADGIATGGETEDVSGHSYFGGFTPWRAHKDIGNYYNIEVDPDLTSQVVRLGSDGAGSGLIYMPALEKLADAETQPVRGMVKTSFMLKPETVGDSGMKLNAIGDHTQDITDDSSVAFEIADNDGTPAVVKQDGSLAGLDPSQWYNVDLTFDVTAGTAATSVKPLDTDTELVSFVKEVDTIKESNALKGIMFNVPAGSSVLADNIKLEYYMASQPKPVVGKIAAVDRDSNLITDTDNVPTNLWAIQIPFGCTLDPATANKNTITFKSATGDTIDYRAKIERNSYYIYLDEGELAGGTEYQVTVPATVANTSGEELGQEFKFKFKTAGSVVEQKPVVGKIAAVDRDSNPITDINNVPTNLWAIQIPFGCTLDPATANKNTITFKSATGDTIDYRAKIEKDSYYIYLDEGELAGGTEYQVTVPATVANTSGDTLEQEFKFKFRTIDAASGLMRIRSVKVNDEAAASLSDITAGSTLSVITDKNEEVMIGTGIVVFCGKDGEPVRLITEDAYIVPGTDDPAFTVNVPSELDMTKIGKVSIFIWDALDGMNPYCLKASFSE